MEENVQEPVYLNYGQSKINQLDFLTAAANSVLDYVAKLSWSNKRKLLFMKAYSDIMSKGVVGASNNTGNWEIEYNGNIDLESKSQKEREMYGEAAYFIQLQMNSITPKSTIDESKKELPLFDNKTFNAGLQAQLGRDKYGGRDYTEAEWNERDKTDQYGIRETTQRASVLASILENYANSLEDGKYNFEESPYTDLNTLKSKMLNAATALRNGTWTTDTLNELGINPEQYLSTGVNDLVTIGDIQMRRGDVPEYYQKLLNEKLKTELEAKIKAELAKKQLTQQAIRNNPFYKVRIKSGLNRMSGWNPNLIANQYTETTLVEKLNELSTRSDWTPDELSLVAGAYKHAPKTPISQQEYNTLKAMTRFKDASKSRFSKIQGVDGIIYDSATGSLIIAGSEATSNQTNWLTGKSDKDKEAAYLESKIPGITNAEWKELTAIGLDIASIVDPEPLSAGGLGVTAAYLRHKAINETPGHKWTFLEGIGLGIDYLTGIIAAIPGFGDATLAAKLLTKLDKPLRVLGRVGAWKDLYDSVPGLKAAYDKWLKGEELTIGDWRAIGQGIRGLAGHSMLNRTNRGIRKTTTKSGYDATPNGISPISKGHGKVNDYLAKRGWIGTKAATDVEVPTLKVKNADGKSEEIRITPELKSTLETEFKKTSKPEERTKIAKEAGVDLKEGQTVEVNNGWRTRVRSYAEATRKTSDSFGTTKESSTRGEDKFESWLKDRNWASKIYYGSNSALRSYRSRLGIISPKTEDSNTNSENATNIPPLSSYQPSRIYNTPLTIESGMHHLNRHALVETAVLNRLQRIENGQFHHKPSINDNVTMGIGDENIKLKVTNGKSGKRFKLTSENGDNTIVYAETSNVESLLKLIAEVIKRQHNKIDSKKLKELRKLFGLKHGGRIEESNDSLQDIIQNFLTKLK